MRKNRVIAAALLLAAAVFAGCSSPAAQTEETKEETAPAPETEAEPEPLKTKLVIAGGEGAGLTAAVQAMEEGVLPGDILILADGEELAADMKNMERFINEADTAEQFKQDINDSYELYLEDIMKAGENENVPEMAAYLSESTGYVREWMEKLGISFGELVKEDGSSVPRSFPAKEGNLNELTADALKKKVSDAEIPVLYGTEILELHYDENGAVSGMRVKNGEEETEILCSAVAAVHSGMLPLFEGIRTTRDSEEKATGLVVTDCAEVMVDDEEGTVIQGLFAAGDLIAAGLHGAEPLPGNELTAMIVYGRTAGTEAAVYLMDLE